MAIDRQFLSPAEFFPVRSKAEAIEEILAADEGDIPKARDATRIFLNGNFVLQAFEQFLANRILLQMSAQFVQCRKDNWRADEEHRLMLQGSHDDLVRGADAINVSRAIGDGKIAGIDHAQVNVQRLPKLLCAPRTGLSALL